MSIRFAIVAVMLAGGVAAPALAQVPPSLSKEYLACHARAHGNIVQEGMCEQREMSAQDARLNKAYQQVMHQLASDPAKQMALRTEQRAWLKRRDYECKVDGQTINGSCLVSKTATRADELESQIRF